MLLLNIGLLFTCMFVNSWQTTEVNSYCLEGGECSYDELKSIIFDQQREARQAQAVSFALIQNCTACFSAPCQNGGNCIPTEKNYTCDCPGDTNGTNCEDIVECRSSSCGPNANCFVANHRINCACKLGFAGDDPYHAGCPLKVKESCFRDDPHFVTFDGLNFDYLGTCPFIVSEPCNGVIPGYPTFSVRAVNARNNQYIATVVGAQLIVYDTNIQVNRNRTELLINGVPTVMPFYLGNESNWRIRVEHDQSGANAIIETDFNLKIVFGFSAMRFCLTVPNIPAFQGNDTLCGLTGNMDGNCQNDLRLRNGTVLPVPANCHVDATSLMTEEYGDHWIVPQQNHGCILGTVLVNKTLPCDAQVLTDAGITCQPISDALNAVGAFSKCQGMGAAQIDRYFRSCQWSLCAPPRGMQYANPVGSPRKCTRFMEFAHACQRALPGTNLGDWRSSLNCPIHCPSPSSRYSECATGCPETCGAHGAPVPCTNPCVEGCTCNSGFVLQNGICKPLGECSCFDGITSHTANSVWFTQNCTVRNECHEGSIVNSSVACDRNAICTVLSGGLQQCVCNTGFTGNGTTCADINECLNDTLCGHAQAHGLCTNTMGGYNCTCNPNYDGQECERFHPRRHCADLFVIQNDRVSGIKTIYPSFAYDGIEPNSPLLVYCDMELDGGGWTAFTGPDGNSTVGKTLAEYKRGFGNVNVNDYWLGLAYLHGATNEFSTTLKIKLAYCNGENVHWNYPDFNVLDEANGYAPVMATNGSGSAGEGWVMNWPEGHGPRFSGIDKCQSVGSGSATTCCSLHGNTGWWYDSYMCGMANLNGIRFPCDHLNANPNTDQSIIWHFNRHPKSAQMLLRPKSYPDYERP